MSIGYYCGVGCELQQILNSMTTTYRLTMSDGTQYQKSAGSAGEAIYAALNKHPGRTVAKCHSGLTESEARELQLARKGAMPGVTEYEIPAHKAIDEPVSVEDEGE